MGPKYINSADNSVSVPSGCAKGTNRGIRSDNSIFYVLESSLRGTGEQQNGSRM